MYRNYEDLRFASSTPYMFEAKNYKAVQELMNPNDKKTFYFDPKTINWKTYLDDYYLGMRKYLLKDMSDIHIMRKKIQR